VGFLTEAQRARYGRFNEVPDEEALAGFFHLDAELRTAAMACRGPRAQLGFALQATTVGYLGTFLPDPATGVPIPVVDYVAAQLGLAATDLTGYDTAETRWDHQAAVRARYGYRSFDAAAWLGLGRWLWAKAWIGQERPSVLFDLATARLIDQQVLLPGVSTLERLVAAVRERAQTRAWAKLAAVPSLADRAGLETLLRVPDGERFTRMDRLRKAPTEITARGLNHGLARYSELAALGSDRWDLSQVPAGRITAAARYARAARAQAVAQLAPDRRMATLVAFAATMTPQAADDALDVFDMLTADLMRSARNQVTEARKRSLQDLDEAAWLLRDAWLTMHAAHTDPDPTVDLQTAMASLDADALDAAATAVEAIARDPEEIFHDTMLERYTTLRRALPHMLEALSFAASGTGSHTLEALEFLRERLGSRRVLHRDDVPTEILSASWRTRVFPETGKLAGGVDLRAYTVAAAENLREHLRRHDVFVPGLRKWGDPRAGLLAGQAWQTSRAQVCRDLSLSPEPGPDLDTWIARAETAYQRLADGIADNPAVRIETTEDKPRLVLTGLDALPEPASLKALRADVEARMPAADLPEVILEVHGWTGCLHEFTHIAGTDAARRDDVITSIAAVLTAQATNVGMEPVSRPGDPALSRDRLFWVEQNHIRADTLTAANARLVDYHSRLALAQAWGGGELASADGLRFVVPVRTINAAPNPKYFGHGRKARGVTFYNFTSDQFTGLHGIVIPGTPRDWYYLLEGLLEQQTSLHPVEITTDTAGASEMGFGIFRMLGWQFSPRLADPASATLYRPQAGGDYGPLEPLLSRRIKRSLVEDSWDDLLRLTGSLRTGNLQVSELFRYLAGGGTPTPIGRALMELGRLDRSAFLASYFDDELLRRRINTQLNRQESRHQFARKIFHGQRGELRQKYR
jgi:TnpA family transposase